MNSETLALAAGAVLSLAFAYVPGLKSWYGARSPDAKRGIMALALLVTSALIYAASCGHVIDTIVLPLVSCDRLGVQALINAFVSALAANQATYMILPKR